MGSSAQTTPAPSRVLKRSTPSTQNVNKTQKSILGFFQPKSSPSAPSTSQRSSNPPASSPPGASPLSEATTNSVRSKFSKQRLDDDQNITPVPSSDAIEPLEEDTPTTVRNISSGNHEFSNTSSRRVCYQCTQKYLLYWFLEFPD